MWVVPDSRGYLGYCCGSKRSERCVTGQTSVDSPSPQSTQHSSSDSVPRKRDVFSSWRDLRREEKHRLLKSFQIRVRVSRPVRRILSVDEVMIGVAGSQHALTIYKKLRRYGMQ